MSLHQTIKEQIKDAMKARDTVRLGVVRGLVASFTNESVSLKRLPTDELSDEEVLNVIRRAVKQRKDSIEQFTKGGRNDLADIEKAELAILGTYLPQMMSRDEVIKIAKAKMAEMGLPAQAGVIDPSKKGMFMGTLMKELKGKADGDTVKSVVDELLTV
ncbi:MAG: GatB/YqeY domain-containing protein [Candidatus Zambryskibacteria bacterium]|nr:GatB/YqeY domain-containing protein [Candidatus Zambryskibacteria bacterium]